MALAPDPVEFISDEIGNQEDTVSIQLHDSTTGGDVQPMFASGWHVEEEVLAQPGRWTLEFGFDYISDALAKYNAYEPGTKFTLSILGSVQMTGRVDRHMMRKSGGGSVLTLSGRDALSPLHDGYVRAQQSFKDASFVDLVKAAMTACGLDPTTLQITNTANRKIKAGIPIQEIAPAPANDLVTQQPINGTLGATQQELQAKVGERWLEYLRHMLDRAGLTLWAAGDGSVILSTPNGQLAPAYQLFRQVAADDLTTNVLDWELDDDCTHRHSEVICFGRGGGRKAGNVKAKGYFKDQEMIDRGYDQALVVHDRDIQTGDQAAYYARRKLAEERRAGWRLEYVFAGHTLPIGNGGNQRAVVVPDTTVAVADLLIGIDGIFYVEGVTRTRSGSEGTQTRIRLMRPGDLVFGEIAVNAAQPAPKPQTNAAAIPVTPYFGQGIPDVAPPNAVGQNAAGLYVDASGNVVTSSQ